MKKSIFFIFCIMSIFLVGCGSSNKKNGLTVSDISPQTNQVSNVSVVKTEDSSVIGKKVIPKGFKAISFLDKVIYVPKEFKNMEVPVKSSNNGMALMGKVFKNIGISGDSLVNEYNVAVFFEKNEILQNMKSYEEDDVLEKIYTVVRGSSQQYQRVPTRDELVSKKICKTVDGHKYLKVVTIIRHLNNSKVDEIENLGIYIFDGTVYLVSVTGMLRANGKHDNDFNIILNTFGTDLKYVEQNDNNIAIENKEFKVSKENFLPIQNAKEKSVIESEAIDFFKNYHRAISNRDFKNAYKCLDPALQVKIGGFDNFEKSYITTASSSVINTEVIFTGTDKVFSGVILDYILEVREIGGYGNLYGTKHNLAGTVSLRKYLNFWYIIDDYKKEL